MDRSFNLAELMKNFRVALVKFPSTCMFGMLCAFWFFYFETLPLEKENAFIFFAFLISIPFSFAVHTFLNQFFDQSKSLLSSVLSTGINCLFAALLFFYLKQISDNGIQLFEVILNLSLVCHLLTTLAFWKSNQNSFWQYNHSLMIHFLYATFVAMLVVSGISLALLMIKTFFGITGHLDNYIFQYAFSSALVVHVFVFLSSLPNKERIIEIGIDYPKYLRFTIQYVLFPIGGLYFVILSSHILYSLLIKGALPHGQTASFISGIGVVAVLTFLLSYPMDLNEPKSYFRKMVTGLNVWLILLGLVAIAAAVQRIQHVGLTEQRCYLLVLSIWVTLISIWRLLGFGYSVKLVPLTLGIVVFIAGFSGPFSATKLSIRSQESRLQKILNQEELTISEVKSAESILEYLKKRHTTVSNESAILDKIRFSKDRLAAKNPELLEYDRKLYFSLDADVEFQTGSFKKFIRLDSSKFSHTRKIWKIEDTKIVFYTNDVIGIVGECTFDVLTKAQKGQQLSFSAKDAESMRFQQNCAGKNIVIQLTDLALDFDVAFTKYKISSYKAFLLY